MGKKIILIWKFSKDFYECHFKTSWEEKYGDEIAVEDTKNSVFPIILATKVDQAIFKSALTQAANILNKEKETNDILCLLHNTEVGGQYIIDNNRKLSEALDKEIRETLGNDNYEIFTGKEGSSTRVLYEKLLSDDPVFNEKAFNQDKIKKEVFDAIWDEYVKKKITRLKFDCFQKCLPIVIDIRGLKECADGGDRTKTSEYLSKIQANKNWTLHSKISLDERNCPFDELREEINQTIEKISTLCKIIEAPSTTPKDIANVMYSEQFNIDDWYSKLRENFERYT